MNQASKNTTSSKSAISSFFGSLFCSWLTVCFLVSRNLIVQFIEKLVCSKSRIRFAVDLEFASHWIQNLLHINSYQSFMIQLGKKTLSCITPQNSQCILTGLQKCIWNGVNILVFLLSHSQNFESDSAKYYKKKFFKTLKHNVIVLESSSHYV